MKPRGPWWLERNLRMVQMNLRETDAGLDAERYAREAAAFGAEAVLFNAGGIVANYPSRLPFHYKNPHLKGDFTGRVLRAVRRRGMKLVARYDFSKVHASLGRKHPDWLYKSVKGKPVLYNGQYHTCLNGAYQQERLFEILDEGLSKYAFDGVFINMFGYFTWDYSHNYHGICQCDGCKRRFKGMHGLKLPTREDPQDPAFRAYQDFCRVTAGELGQRLGRFLKEGYPDTASLSYDYGGADVKCNESNSDTDRALPEWNYSASDNVKCTLGSYKDMPACNAAISFAGHACRHVGVSPWLTQLRLAQDLVHGGWLWFVVIGPFWEQADRRAFAPAREIFRFHKREIRWLGRSESRAGLLLLACGGEAYKGCFRMLSESQRPFDVLEPYRLSESGLPRPLEDYRCVVVPDLAAVDEAGRAVLDAYVQRGGRLLAAGSADASAWRCLGLAKAGALKRARPGQYLSLRPRDKGLLKDPGLEGLDLLYLNDELRDYRAAPGTRSYLRFIPESMFGPPEKCRPGAPSRVPGAYEASYGRGRSLYFPWKLGAHHEPRHFAGHAALFSAALRRLAGEEPRLRVQAHPLLEISHRADPQGAFEWIGLVNHGGQNGSTFHEAPPLGGALLRLRPGRPVKRARLLKAGRALAFKRLPGGWLECRLPAVGRYEILLFES